MKFLLIGNWYHKIVEADDWFDLITSSKIDIDEECIKSISVIPDEEEGSSE